MSSNWNNMLCLLYQTLLLLLFVHAKDIGNTIIDKYSISKVKIKTRPSSTWYLTELFEEQVVDVVVDVEVVDVVEVVVVVVVLFVSSFEE